MAKFRGLTFGDNTFILIVVCQHGGGIAVNALRPARFTA